MYLIYSVYYDARIYEIYRDPEIAMAVRDVIEDLQPGHIVEVKVFRASSKGPSILNQ